MSERGPDSGNVETSDLAFDPSDQEGMLEAARSNLQHIEQILEKYDAFDLLAAFRYFENSFDPETYSEPSHRGLGAAVEFVASVSAKNSYVQRRSKQIEPNDLTQLHELAHSSIAIAQFLQMAKSNSQDGGDDANLNWISSEMAVNSMVVRGHAYPHHLKEILLELASELDPVVEEALGFSLSNAVGIDDALLEFETTMGQDAFDDMERLEERFRAYAKGELSHEELTHDFNVDLSWLKALSDQSAQKVLDQFCHHYVMFSLGAVCAISSQDLANKTGLSESIVNAFIRTFSVQFSEIESSIVLPSATSSFLQRPLVFADNKFLRINNDLYSYILPRVERLLNPNGAADSVGSEKQWKTFHRKRDSYLERKAMGQFKRMMPNAMIETSLRYPLPGDESGAMAELDCLVVHDNNFIFVEAKASTISDSTRRGSTLKIKNDSRKGIEKGAKQAARAAEYIKSSQRSVAFHRKDGSTLDITLPPIRNCFHVVVTLDHMDALFVNNTRLFTAGLAPDIDNLWAVGIRDLLVFGDVIEFPTQLIHYIERRTFSLQKHSVFVSDELDLLCYYLAQGLYFERMFDSKPTRISLMSNTQTLDDYYNFVRGVRETSAEKPRQDLPAELRDVIWGMEDKGLPAASEAIRILLSMSGETRDELVEGIEASVDRCRVKGQHSSIAMAIAHYGLTYFVFPSSELDQMRSLVGNYLSVKRAETQAAHWVAICACVERPYQIVWTAVASATANSRTS